ncbi:MAG TPA: DUF262 domain-containing protein, partial [Thermoanaerobaculia bacterium]|nr:DUF262 domain-containing protein [Thermoanaerobaculia bacterium]
WEDVRGVADSILARRVKAHFLGAVVFKMEVFLTGGIEVREVIDGQQRLATVLILIKVLRDLCSTHELDDARELESLLFNDPGRCVKEDDRFKLLPNNVDREPFLAVMNAAGPAELQPVMGAGDERKPIIDAYLFFSDQVQKWLDDGKDSRRRKLDALKTAIQDCIRIVVIDLDEHDDPQTIFESLNARGTPLLASDLLKNYLFQRAKAEGADLERLYEQQWKALDDDPGYWRQDVGRGHAKRPRIDLLLQHFTAARVGEEVVVEALYRRFREWAEAPGSDLAERQLSEFRRWADRFRRLDTLRGDDEEGQFFERIRLLDIATIFPLILALYDSDVHRPEALVIIRQDLESFLVRRMVTGLSTRSYGRLFLQLLSEVRQSANPAERTIRDSLLAQTSETARWPDDAEFGRAWLERPIGSILRRDRIEMTLKALERRGRSDRSEPLDLARKLTVEHVLPEDWERTWPIPPEQRDDKAHLRRYTLVQTMGNLTLVTGKLNSSMGNNPWDRKQRALAEYSALWLNAYLLNSSDWNEEAITARGAELLSLACQVWPRPVAAAPLPPPKTIEEPEGEEEQALEDEEGPEGGP